MRTGRPIEYDLEQVLDSATGLFWRLGYRSTSLNDLMQATALSKSSFYQLFASKHEVFVRCLERYQDQTTADLWRRLESAKSGRQFIVDALMWVIEEAHSVDQPRGCLVMNTASEIAQHDAEIADCVTRGLQRYHAIFQHAIKRAQQEGTIRRDWDKNLLADYLVTNMSGLRTMVKAGSSSKSLQNMVAVIMQALT